MYPKLALTVTTLSKQTNKKMSTATKNTAEEDELPSKDSALTEEFLGTYVKINTQLTEKVAKILHERNVLDVATLLTWGRKGKDVLFHDLFGDLPNANTFKGITGLLWEFILKYHPERATKFAAPVGQKKVEID